MPAVSKIGPILAVALALLCQACSHQVGGVDRRWSTTATDSYTLTRNIVFTPEDWPEPVMGDFYRPRQSGPLPAVLLIHGGGWTGKDGRWQMNPIARKLAKRGYAVFNVTYRLAPKWRYPAPLEDVHEALKWMRDHTSEQGLDPHRFATFGYSAGGYLAAFAGFEEPPAGVRVRAIVAGGAPSDLTFYAGGDLVPQFLGGRLEDIPDTFAEASPVHYVTPRTPPVFLYHAERDGLVRPEHAHAMIDALEENHVSHKVHWIKGRGHIDGFLLPGKSVDEAVDFLDANLR